jgi:16S rRNA (cytosine967-C5)-methyltransferase
MLVLTHARDILAEIIFNQLPFTEAIKKIFKQSNVDFASQSLVRSLTSCELHHHLLLSHLVETNFPSLDKEDKLLLQTALGNNIFIKRITIEEVEKFIKDFLISKSISSLDIENFMATTKTGSRLISPSIKDGTSAYLSLKYNSPEWLVLMWQKHFGFPTTLKILSSNGRPVLQACRVNTLRTTTESVLEQDGNFSRGPIEGSVIYHGTEPLKSRPLYSSNLVFQQRMGVTDIINKFNFDTIMGEILVVEARPNALYLELPVVTKDRVKVNVATSSVERKQDISKAIANFEFKNINVFESTPKLLISHVSHSQDFIMALPACTKFDLIRSLPDFFIHFNQSEIDQLVKDQKEMLDECAPFVSEGGVLGYGLNTMNKKESSMVIEDFLKRHPEFFLVLEKQYFPFEDHNSALYIAAMRKRTTPK